MNKVLLLSLILLQACRIASDPKPRPNHPPPPSVSLHQIDESDFNKIDQNSDGVLDKGEIQKATEIDTLEAPLKIFFALAVAIVAICLVPFIPALIKGAIKLYKG